MGQKRKPGPQHEEHAQSTCPVHGTRDVGDDDGLGPVPLRTRFQGLTEDSGVSVRHYWTDRVWANCDWPREFK